MEEQKLPLIKLTIKQKTNTFTIEVEPDASIPQLKEKVKEQTKIDVAEQRLIFKGTRRGEKQQTLLGHILKDEENIAYAGIRSGDSVDLIQAKKHTTRIDFFFSRLL